MSTLEQQQAALQAEIARLTGEINRHKQSATPPPAPLLPAAAPASHPPSFRPGINTWRPSSSSAPISRHPTPPPYATKNKTLNRAAVFNTGTSTSAAPPPAAPAPRPPPPRQAVVPQSHVLQASRNRKLVLNGAVPTPAPAPTLAAAPSAPPAHGGETWVARKDRHMSLINTATFQKTEPARQASIAATLQAKSAAKAAKAAARAEAKRARRAAVVAGKSTASVTSADGKRRIMIDGVAFEFDPSGTKLVKVAASDLPATPSASTSPAAASATAAAASPNTPKHTTIDGAAYIRTKSGNLVSAALVRKRSERQHAQTMAAKRERLGNLSLVLGHMQRARNTKKPPRAAPPAPMNEEAKRQAGRKMCPRFTKTGRCPKALHCPFTHDSDKTAICQHFLKKRCRHTASTCPLSHSPNPHNMPFCAHFDSPNSCRMGADCPYPHVHLGKDAGVCRDFAILGWCERGAECAQRHVWECPEFAEKGTCSNRKCRLPHILRSEKGKCDVEDEEFAAPVSGPKRKTGDDADEGAALDSETALRAKRFKVPRKRFDAADDLMAQNDFVTFEVSDSEDEESGSDQEEDDWDGESVESEGLEEEDEEEKEGGSGSRSEDEADSDAESEKGPSVSRGGSYADGEMSVEGSSEDVPIF